MYLEEQFYKMVENHMIACAAEQAKINSEVSFLGAPNFMGICYAWRDIKGMRTREEAEDFGRAFYKHVRDFQSLLDSGLSVKDMDYDIHLTVAGTWASIVEKDNSLARELKEYFSTAYDEYMSVPIPE